MKKGGKGKGETFIIPKIRNDCKRAMWKKGLRGRGGKSIESDTFLWEGGGDNKPQPPSRGEAIWRNAGTSPSFTWCKKSI